MAGDDFVMVQLTAAGIVYAGGHPLTVNGNKRTFTFAATPAGGVPVQLRVERSYEWGAVLSRQLTNTWQPLCELVPAAVPAPIQAHAAIPGALPTVQPPIFVSPAPPKEPA